MSTQDVEYCLDFDREVHNVKSVDGKEKIGRQINIVNPIRQVWPLARKKDIERKIRDGRITPVIRRRGVLDAVRTDEERAEVLNIVGKLKYGADNMLMSDLGAAINSNSTHPNPNNRAEFYNQTDVVNRDGNVLSTSVVMSREGAIKLALGPLVDSSGRAITGAGKTVKKCRERLESLLMMKVPPPVAMTTMNLNGELLSAMAPPVHISEIAFSKRPLYKIVIDRRFFPVQDKPEKGRVVKDLYVHQVAGLYSVLRFGSRVLGKRLHAEHAYKVVMYLQAAMDVKAFAPGILRRLANGRYDLCFREESTVKSLVKTDCEVKEDIQWLKSRLYNNNGRLLFQRFSEFIANCGQMYMAAINELGILEQLNDNILIPATDKGAQYYRSDPETPELLYLKAQKVKRDSRYYF